jgi:hypothetical protein
VPAWENVAVVAIACAFANVTVPGPEILLQVVVTGPGLPSSVTVPVSAAAPCRGTLLMSEPALTIGATFTGVRKVSIRKGGIRPSLASAVRRPMLPAAFWMVSTTALPRAQVGWLTISCRIGLSCGVRWFGPSSRMTVQFGTLFHGTLATVGVRLEMLNFDPVATLLPWRNGGALPASWPRIT